MNHSIVNRRELLIHKLAPKSEKNHQYSGGQIDCKLSNKQHALESQRTIRYFAKQRRQMIRQSLEASRSSVLPIGRSHQLVLLLVATLYVSVITVRAEDDTIRSTPSGPVSVTSELRESLIDSENIFERRALLQADSNEDDNDKKISSRRDSINDENIDSGNDDPKYITKEPRQQFKIHFGPTKSHKRTFKSMVAKRQQDGSASVASPDSRQTGNSTTGSTRVRAKSGKQMLTSETLKKLLLNQSMLSKNPNLYYSNASALNGTSTSRAGSNFKFVFIQRATAAPSKTASTPKNDSSSATGSLSNQSLAASVSKQLASSLLYSAANLVGNLTAAPSISALTSTVSAKTATSSPVDSDIGGATGVSAQDTGSNDIRRVQSLATGLSSPSRKSQRPSRRPSKVYNLPVKFVANGQPNGVVFSAIKQHFATIRKMQSAAAAAANSNRKITTFSSAKDKRKQQNQSDKKKWKGGNSRLIYLPLKYLSNAKPEGLVRPKAAHKSVATTLN